MPEALPRALCIHGLGVTGRHFKPLARVLKGRILIDAPDLPGFGKNRIAFKEPTIAKFADSLKQQLAHDRMVLVGHSMGTQIALQLLLEQPNLFRGAVLISPTVTRNERTAQMQLKRLLEDSLHEPLSLNAVVLRDYIRCGPSQFLKTLRATLLDLPEQKALDSTIPILIIRGSEDPLVSREWAEELAHVYHAELVEVPGAAHAVQATEPQRVAQLITAFSDAHPA